MKLRFKELLLGALLSILGPSAWAQYTAVTAQVKDNLGTTYANCRFTVSFVNLSTSSDAPQLQGGDFQREYGGAFCDASGNLSISLPDNNLITPNDVVSNWKFSICASDGTTCFNTNVLITGATQDITANIKSAAASLPTEGGTYQESTIPNEATTGTTLYKIAKLTGAPSTVIIASHTDTMGFLGVVMGGAGKTGSPAVVISGLSPCVFDGATTANHYVQNSSTVDGDCHDAGATPPGSGQTVGQVLSTNAAGGTYTILVSSTSSSSGGGSGTVTSFSSGNLAALFNTSVATATSTPAQSFSLPSRSANLVFASPDGSSGTPAFRAVTSADLASTTGTGTAVALAASPALTGTPTVPTAASTDSSTTAASTQYVTTAVANAIAAVNPAVAVQAASAAVLPNSPTYANGVAGIGATLTGTGAGAALVVDGYTVLLNDRVLVKNQSTASQNGVYTQTILGVTGVTNWVLTRALDFDQPSDMNNTGSIPVVNGTANASTSWLLTSTVNTVGTDSATFSQFTISPSKTLTTTLTSAHWLIGNGSNLATDVAVGGDISSTNAGVVTVNKVNGVAYGASPATNTVPVITGSNTVTYEAVPVAAGGTGLTASNTEFCPYGCQVTGTGITPGSANQIRVSSFYLPYTITVSNIVVNVVTADNTNNSDWGIYDSTGALKLNVGAHTSAATGAVSLAATQGSTTLTPGVYYMAITSVSTTLSIGRVSATSFMRLGNASSATASTGGVLPNSATMPADNLTVAGQSIGFYLK